MKITPYSQFQNIKGEFAFLKKDWKEKDFDKKLNELNNVIEKISECQLKAKTAFINMENHKIEVYDFAEKLAEYKNKKLCQLDDQQK